MSGVTSPLTTADPSPQLASITMTEVSPVTGLRVKSTPAQRALTITCTTTPMASVSSGTPWCRR